MDKKKSEELPIISSLKTSGLTSIDQITNSTDNDLFCFQKSTSEPENNLVVIYPFYKEKKEKAK